MTPLPPFIKQLPELAPFFGVGRPDQFDPRDLGDQGVPVNRVLRVSHVDRTVLVESGPDGFDYVRFCDLPGHQWASLPSTRIAYVQECPHCAAEADGMAGRMRYFNLHAADVRIQGL